MSKSDEHNSINTATHTNNEKISNDILIADIFELLNLIRRENLEIGKLQNAVSIALEDLIHSRETPDNEEIIIEKEEIFDKSMLNLKNISNYFETEIDKLFEIIEDKITKSKLNNSQIDTHHNVQTKQEIHTPLLIESDISKNQKFNLNPLLTINDNKLNITLAEKITQRKSNRIMKRQNKSSNRKLFTCHLIQKRRKQKHSCQLKQNASQTLNRFVNQNQQNPRKKKQKYFTYDKNQNTRNSELPRSLSSLILRNKIASFNTLVGSRVRKFFLPRHWLEH